MELSSYISEATTEVFNTMLTMEVTPGETRSKRERTFRGTISGMVGMAGSCKGLVAIHLPEPVATHITGSFLGMEVDAINEDVQDAIGELANMLAGNLKGFLLRNGLELTLSIPSTVWGDEYTLDCPQEESGVIVPFALPGGEFLVEVQLQEIPG